mmetsp:Transcript_46350/g.116732  ORF Transcript_46350/g.116732 Transcript_46350/m.116732 type:complete len:224 (+) Transcript_46350:357-1028(+)
MIVDQLARTYRIVLELFRLLLISLAERQVGTKHKVDKEDLLFWITERLHERRLDVNRLDAIETDRHTAQNVEPELHFVPAHTQEQLYKVAGQLTQFTLAVLDAHKEVLYDLRHCTERIENGVNHLVEHSTLDMLAFGQLVAQDDHQVLEQGGLAQEDQRSVLGGKTLGLELVFLDQVRGGLRSTQLAAALTLARHRTGCQKQFASRYRTLRGGRRLCFLAFPT